jgi:hypothetical protein
MTYREAESVWTELIHLMADSSELAGYRPVIQHIEGDVVNDYMVYIRPIYDFVEIGGFRKKKNV